MGLGFVLCAMKLMPMWRSFAGLRIPSSFLTFEMLTILKKLLL
jgi:hypothetical protein